MSLQNNENQEERRCLFCGSIINGRSDKKYCDDYCRNNHHYQQNGKKSTLVKGINDVLMRNHSILCSLNKKKETVVPMEQLKKVGFDFDSFTGLYDTKKGKVYRLVYDQAYCIVGDTVQLLRFVMTSPS